MDDQQHPNLADPAFEPTDEQMSDLLRSAGRVARWRAAMAAQGVKVLAMGMSIDEQARQADAWERDNSSAAVAR